MRSKCSSHHIIIPNATVKLAMSQNTATTSNVDVSSTQTNK